MKKAHLLLVIACSVLIISACTDEYIEVGPPVYYEPVQIGNQIWMKRNLHESRYRNGDPIPEVRDSAQWANLTTGAWCYYKNNQNSIFGKLYNWYAVNDPRGLAPQGWHIPSDSEWKVLTNFLGGEEIAGGKLKDSTTNYWLKLSSGATNESGFYALPGGYRQFDSKFGDAGNYANWWSSAESSITSAWFFNIVSEYNYLYRIDDDKKYGFSVRCVKDLD